MPRHDLIYIWPPPPAVLILCSSTMVQSVSVHEWSSSFICPQFPPTATFPLPPSPLSPQPTQCVCHIYQERAKTRRRRKWPYDIQGDQSDIKKCRKSYLILFCSTIKLMIPNERIDGSCAVSTATQKGSIFVMSDPTIGQMKKETEEKCHKYISQNRESFNTTGLFSFPAFPPCAFRRRCRRRLIVDRWLCCLVRSLPPRLGNYCPSFISAAAAAAASHDG
jgi:hypothetical protein